ncbi:MAG: ABC transporter permease [Verrucomicrobiota bacterium]|jgi:phospholipid/cholesterol/gamma-HCH transport system permease protein|nr:ABC transporter permease [Verrucomicrobiota bacterium]
MITREPIDMGPSSGVWGAAVLGVGEIGRAGRMTADALAGIPAMLASGRRRGEWVRQMFMMGIKSLPVITVVGMFTGMILGLQVGLELRRFNQEVYIGSGVMVAMLREMGPFMTGLILAACVGSSMAAQLGTMTVNDEIAALEIMSISPVRYLMTPRIAAMVVMTPILSFYTCVLGVLGGGLVGLTQLNVPWNQYISMAINFADLRDLYVGLLKALVFGVVITGVSCYEGFTTTMGAVGVGQATRRSVIISFLLILVLGYMVTRLFYDL